MLIQGMMPPSAPKNIKKFLSCCDHMDGIFDLGFALVKGLQMATFYAYTPLIKWLCSHVISPFYVVNV